MVRLESVLDSWKTVRADAAQAVEDLSPALKGIVPATTRRRMAKQQRA
jgi:hypothetical protein